VGFDPFPAEFHGIDGLPAHVNVQEVVIVGVGAFLLCAIAAVIPAFLTSRRDPARCLRNY
jgi:lipoprotein-releasing system permease protein